MHYETVQKIDEDVKTSQQQEQGLCLEESQLARGGRDWNSVQLEF